MPPLSAHLFWDVDRAAVDPALHARRLAKRVLEYGFWSDWQALVRHYGKSQLAETVVQIRSLDPRFRVLPRLVRSSFLKLPMRCCTGRADWA